MSMFCGAKTHNVLVPLVFPLELSVNSDTAAHFNVYSYFIVVHSLLSG